MPREPVQRRLAAILAADVAGYSRLMGEGEEGTRTRFNAHLRELIEPTIASRRGRIVKTTGDALLVEFASVVDAVQCAVEIQKGMAERNADQPDDRQIVFRIGVNLGDVIIEGDDIHGDGVNVAARLEALADPGGVVISDKVHSEIRNKLDLGFDDLGPQEVKNIAEPVHAFSLGLGKAVNSMGEPETPTSLPLPDRPSIAVLPFNNMSGDPEQEYFSDGITEDLTTALSRFDGLFVIARNSAFSYKGEAVDVKRVGQELGVRYVLEGSVRRAGDRVRINAQLVDAETDRHVWAERFDRQMDDVFELQDDIVASIAATVGPEITLAEIERARGKRPGTLDAWDHYLRAIAAYHRMTKDDVADAISLLEEAITVEPEFANAYALLGLCHTQIGVYGWIKPVRQAYEKARRMAEEAYRLAPTSPEANRALAFVLMATGQADQAVTAARQ